eukprot:3280108-Ditylum_brightwellii.AAC.1
MSPYQYEGDEAQHDPILKTKQSIACNCTSPHCHFCLLPGNTVSTNKYESCHCGCLPHTRGKEPDSSKCCGGTIVADNSSSFLFHQSHVSLNTNDTLNTKHAFDNFADIFNVCIKHYCCGNGIFKSVAFTTDCTLKSHCKNFCSVDAHHQNGVAEHAINTITTWSHAMLIHIMLHWTEQVTTDLWPFAFGCAVFLHNHLPKCSHHSTPIELFTQTTMPHLFFMGAHVWGCLVYVLQPTLCEGKKIIQWAA